MSAPNPKQAKPGRSSASRLYVFTVVTIAVLLAMLAWRHPRGTEFVVEADMRYSRLDNTTGEPVGDEQDINAIAEEMRSNDSIQASLASMDASWVKQIVPQTKGEDNTAAIAERLFVRVEPDAEPGNHQIKVRYIGQPREFAQKIIEKLTARFADQHNNAAAADAASKRLSEAGIEAERVASRIQELETQLDHYVTAEIEATRANHELQQRRLQLAKQESNDSQPEPVSQPMAFPQQEPAPSARMPIVEALNPAWETLNSNLSEADQQLRDLLVRKTREHPDVQRAEMLVSELRQQLSETAQFIDPGQPIELPTHTVITNDTLPPNPPANLAGTPSTTQTDVPLDAPRAEVPEDSVSTNDVDSAEMDPMPTVTAFDADAERDRILNSAVGSRLRQQIAACQQDREQQLTELAALEQQQVTFRESTLLVGHPRVLRHYTDELQRTTLWSCLGIGCVVGLLIATMRRKPPTPDTIYSIGDAEKALQTRALGTISTNDGPLVLKPDSPTLPICVRPLVRVAEVTLFISAAVVVLAAFSVPEFGSQFIENPFAAFAVAVDYVSDFVG